MAEASRRLSVLILHPLGLGSRAMLSSRVLYAAQTQHGSDAMNAQVCHPVRLIAHKDHCPPFCSPFVQHRVKGACSKQEALLFAKLSHIPFFWWCYLKPHGQYKCIEHIVCKRLQGSSDCARSGLLRLQLPFSPAWCITVQAINHAACQV